MRSFDRYPRCGMLPTHLPCPPPPLPNSQSIPAFPDEIITQLPSGCEYVHTYVVVSVVNNLPGNHCGTLSTRAYV